MSHPLQRRHSLSICPDEMRAYQAIEETLASNPLTETVIEEAKRIFEWAEQVWQPKNLDALSMSIDTYLQTTTHYKSLASQLISQAEDTFRREEWAKKGGHIAPLTFEKIPVTALRY